MRTTDHRFVIGDLMRAHSIERIVFVPKSELLSRDEFHAWRFDNPIMCGVGLTVEEAIADADKLERRAA